MVNKTDLNYSSQQLLSMESDARSVAAYYVEMGKDAKRFTLENL